VGAVGEADLDGAVVEVAVIEELFAPPHHAASLSVVESVQQGVA